MSALTDAEQAHRQLREAAEMAKEGRFAEAEATAEAGVNQLNLRSVILNSSLGR